MSHECPECGFECDCDGEDHAQPAPADCLCAIADIELGIGEDSDEDSEGAAHDCPACGHTCFCNYVDCQHNCAVAAELREKGLMTSESDDDDGPYALPDEFDDDGTQDLHDGVVT